MVYQNKFVVSVKANGKILREDDDVVYLPFGSEYTILIKNLNSKRAKVNIDIDGQEVVHDLVVNANSDVEVERFLKGNMNTGHKLKFIEKTQQISDHRGDRIDDGIIRVEYAFEKNKPYMDWNFPIQPMTKTYRTKNVVSNKYLSYDNSSARGITHDSHVIGNSYNSFAPSNHSGEITYQANVNHVSDEGITVEGSQSFQKFVSVRDFQTDASEVITLKLKGAVIQEEKIVEVTKPVTVKTKRTCHTCGTKNKWGSKFCSECGTALTEF